jgi:predicted porin
MKKTLIVAAILASAVGTAAHAQSSVTLYGLVDAGYQYSKTQGQASRSAIDSGGQSDSRFGIRGTEDLGGGLKANFLLESGINVDDGSTTGSSLFNRQAWVGLSSTQFGELRVGRHFILGSAFFTTIDPFGTTFRQAGMGTTFAAANQARNNNTAMYFSPNFAGFQGAIGYSFNSNAQEVPGNANNNRAITTGLRYQNGPIEAAITYDRLDPANGGSNGIATQVGGAYDFGVVKLHAAYSDQRNMNLANAATGSSSNAVAPTAFATNTKSYMLGVSAPIGAGNVFASYQKATDWDIKGYSLGYTYSLSRRTNVYAYFSDIDNVASRQSVSNDIATRQAGFGLRHMF